MKKIFLVFLLTFEGALAFVFNPPTIAEAPVAKEESAASCAAVSIKSDLGEMRGKVMDILDLLDQIDAKQSELTSLTASYENLNEKYDILLDAINRLLSQECKADSPSEATPSGAANPCVDDCVGMPDGDYQSCQACTVYATCSNDILDDNRPCPSNGAGDPLLWDDNKKRCEYTSPTCDDSTVSNPTESETPPSGAANPCVDDCVGMPDGDYQSCQACTVYATCSNDILYDNRPCPSNGAGDPLLWDDDKKRCEYTSPTCDDSTVSNPTESETPPSGAANPCVDDCVGMPDGDYQSCLACTVYATCSNDILDDNRPCPSNGAGDPLLWDDNKKKCEYTSPTCFEMK